MIEQVVPYLESILEILILVLFFIAAIRQYRFNALFLEAIRQERKSVYRELLKFRDVNAKRETPHA